MRPSTCEDRKSIPRTLLTNNRRTASKRSAWAAGIEHVNTGTLPPICAAALSGANGPGVPGTGRANIETALAEEKQVDRETRLTISPGLVMLHRHSGGLLWAIGPDQDGEMMRFNLQPDCDPTAMLCSSSAEKLWVSTNQNSLQRLISKDFETKCETPPPRTFSIRPANIITVY